ncbi:MAG: glycerol-3-phosphate dehydrogenase/oxidase [Mycobacteriales bacterium]
MDTALNAARRDRELAALATGEVVDLLVVGGGVTGAGVALDAASRGLSVALLERADLASGTSRWSSKLVHGGLRYLASGDYAIAAESARERGLLMERTAPHLTRALPMLTPLTSGISRRSAAWMYFGLQVGDGLRRYARTRRTTLPRPRRLSRTETCGLVPALAPDRLSGGLLYWDGQLVDDARLVVALARTAAGYGARILTHCRVTALAGDGAEVTDTRTGTRFAVRARAVVNATGVWAGTLTDGIRLRPSKGTHLVLDSAAFGGLPAALSVRVPGGHNQYVIALPQPDDTRVYVGLTDTPVDGEIPDEPVADPADVTFLLDTLSTVLGAPLGPDAVLGTYAGLRPLLEGDGDSTADLSRRHAVLVSDDGVVTATGGKLTTYRQMAADAVDAAVARAGLAAGPCRTRRLPLVGAAPRPVLAGLGVPHRLVMRYGTEAAAVLAEAGPELSAPVAPGLAVTGAELLWAVRHEGALDVADLLDRRTRLGLVAADRAAALPAAEQVLGLAQVA